MPGRQKITGKKPMFGQARSKALNATKRKFKLNLQSKRIFVPELKRHVRVRLTAHELKTVDKIGLMAFLKQQGRSVNSLL